MIGSEPRVCARCGATKPIEAFKQYRNSAGNPTYAKTCTHCYVLDTLARRRAASERRYNEMIPGLLTLIAAHGPIRVREMMKISPGNPQLAGQVLSRAEKEGLIYGVLGSGGCKRWSLAADARLKMPDMNIDELIRRREINEEMNAWFAQLQRDIEAKKQRRLEIRT